MPATEATATPETPEAPAEEATAAPAPQEVVEEPRYQRWDFPAEPETPTEAAPEETAAPETTAADADSTPEAQEPGTQPAAASDDFDDETWERIKKSPRIERLVDNRYGNKLVEAQQRAREEAAQHLREQDAKWQESTALYNRLSEDEDAFNQAVAENGSPAVRRFMADYEEAAAVRQQTTGPQAQAIEAAKQQFAQGFAQQFNDAALQQVKAAIPATIPFYGELPEETRTAIENLVYNPEGNFLAEGLTALGKGLKAREDRIQREHKAALEQATEAGRNEARAAAEGRGPLIVKPGENQFTDFKQAEEAYASGRINYEQFVALRRQHGRDV